jgi:putative nucleotidyltransferase with HDIG domain
MNIEELFQEETQIPSLPNIFYEFKEAVEDPNRTFDDVAEIVSLDPGLTARLLKIVNSAFYGFPSEIETISHAISIIGIQHLNDLVLSTVVMGCFKDIPAETIDMESFWKHSIACALTSKILAQKMETPSPERVFVAGLLHDIGRLIICSKASMETLKIFFLMNNQNLELHLAEREALGFDHSDVGARLMKQWGLPKIHEEIVNYHHKPSQASSFPDECAIVHTADILVNSLELGISGETVVQEFDEEASKRTNIQDESFRSLLVDEVKEKFDETFQLFFQPA